MTQLSFRETFICNLTFTFPSRQEAGFYVKKKKQKSKEYSYTND